MSSSGSASTSPRVCAVRFGWQPFIMAPLYHLTDGLHARGIATTIVKSYARQDLGLSEEPHPRAEMKYFRLIFKSYTKLRFLGPAFKMLGWLEFVGRAALLAYRTPASLYIAIDVDALPAAWLTARLRKKPLIFYSYELYTDRPWVRPKWFWDILERLLIHGADLVVACEPNRARVMQERYKLRDTPMTVLNVPPRSETETPRGGRIREVLRARGIEPSCVLYFHGWINRARCADKFIEALAELEPSVVLFFIGPSEPAFLEELKALARSLGVEQRVVFHPMVPTEELMAFAASADVGLQAQRNEGLNSYYCAPIKLFQYFAAGLPVIASNFPGMLETVAANDLGLCVDPESVDEIRAAMAKLASDPALRARQSENARRLARERYCHEAEAAPLLAYIESLVRATAPLPPAP